MGIKARKHNAIHQPLTGNDDARSLELLGRGYFESDDELLNALVAVDDGEEDEDFPSDFVEMHEGTLSGTTILEFEWTSPLSVDCFSVLMIYNQRIDIGVVLLDGRAATGELELCAAVGGRGCQPDGHAVAAALGAWITRNDPTLPDALLNLRPNFVSELQLRTTFAVSERYASAPADLEKKWALAYRERR